MNPTSWRAHVISCNADFVVALTDTPFTLPPFSQKRLTKSIERSISWLAQLLQPFDTTPPPPPQATSPILDDGQRQNGATTENLSDRHHPLNVLVHMAGDTSAPARRAFAASLTETLYGKEAEQVKPLRTLDEGVRGYVFDLLPLRTSLIADLNTSTTTTSSSNSSPTPEPEPPNANANVTPQISSLLQTSLHDLPADKLRIVHTAASPHEMLALVRDVGVDMFDAQWAQRAADCGVALDFAFPVPSSAVDSSATDEGHDEGPDEQGRGRGRGRGKTGGKSGRNGGKRDLGHNLYDEVYASDFSRFADCLVDGASAGAHDTSSSSSSSSSSSTETETVCPCIACSPISPAECLQHSSLDVSESPVEKVEVDQEQDRFEPPFTRAYVHHLLHTHEMSAHTFLAAHNLAVLDAFFAGVRRTLSRSTSISTSNAKSNSETETANNFAKEVERFNATYDESQQVFVEAKKAWAEVEYARGKGRLAREKVRKAEAESGLDGGVVEGV